MQDLSTRIALKSDSVANWETANPILLSGEVAVVIDGQNQLFKVGDGIRNFNDLPYSFYEQFASKLVQTDMLKAKSISQGYGNEATGIGDVATGYKSSATSNFAQAHGYQAKVSSDFGYVWNGDNQLSAYADHGNGSYSINPKNGISGFYIGERNLKEIISSEAPEIDLSEYYKTSETSSAAELSAEFKRQSAVTLISNDVAYSKDLSVIRLSADEYYNLVIDDAINPSALYVIDDSVNNAFGRQIKNVAEPELSSDAATKNYVDQSVLSEEFRISSSLSSKMDRLPAQPDGNEYVSYVNANGDASRSNVPLSALETVTANVRSTYYVEFNSPLGYGSLFPVKYKNVDPFDGYWEFYQTYERRVGNFNGTVDLIEVKDQDGLLCCYLKASPSSPYLIEGDILSGEHLHWDEFERLGHYEFQMLGTSCSMDLKKYYDANSYSRASTDKLFAKKTTFIKDTVSTDVDILKINKVTRQQYDELSSAGQLREDELYVVDTDVLDAKKNWVINVKTPELSSDAANKAYVDDHQSSLLNQCVQVIRPADDHDLNLSVSICYSPSLDDDIPGSPIDSSVSSKYFSGLAIAGESASWQTMLSGFNKSFSNKPVEIDMPQLFADTNFDTVHTRKLYLKYSWYWTDSDSAKHHSDAYSTQLPATTEVGANSNDVVSKKEHIRLKDAVFPPVQAISKEYGMYTLNASMFEDIRDEIANDDQFVLDKYDFSNSYRMKFKTATSENDISVKFLVDRGNGPETDDNMSISCVAFSPNCEYTVEVKYNSVAIDSINKTDIVSYLKNNSSSVKIRKWFD